MFKKSKHKKPSGPSIFTILFNDAIKNPLITSINLLQDYGEIVRMPGFFKIYLISSPSAAGHILQDNHENYIKADIAYKSLRDVIGRGILTEPDYKKWWPMRQTLNPVFYSKYLLQHIPEITTHIENMCNDWAKFAKVDTPININQEMTSLTATTAISLLFGKEYLDIKNAMLRFTKVGNRYASSIYHMLRWLFVPNFLAFNIVKKLFDSHIKKMIAQHNQEKNPSYNFLTVLLQAKDPETQQSYSQQRIIDEIVTIAVTGHETISNIVTWALYSIARNSAIAQRLQEEYATVLGGRSPNAEDLPQLTYTRMVLEETMRCYPVIWTVNRKVLKDDVVNGYLIPAGSLVAVSIYNIHHNPNYWEQPNLFHPERFTIEKIRQQQRYAYMPFGAGPRNCIGSHFALIEAQLILAVILQRYEIQVVNHKPVDMLPLITLKPAKNIMLRIKERST